MKLRGERVDPVYGHRETVIIGFEDRGRMRHGDCDVYHSIFHVDGRSIASEVEVEAVVRGGVRARERCDNAVLEKLGIDPSTIEIID